MRRYLYRCTLCRTTSPICFGTAELDAQSSHHRDAVHSGHYPDGERSGAVDRTGRWYADMGPLTALHTRLTDEFADLRDPKGNGLRLWAWALSWLTLSTAGLLAVWATGAVLSL
ncbi:hypothetical protein M8Z33_42080 [Streptomyces sp. ZAF1911]|uniref:hypothetical protein n=1 Tax=Streptomyces sp. ZAF1911 TaxID=2944129 RepID=UPI00237B0A5A|nr:hypothetical protein [Streptomyces sp. ZAF1911]MDD9383128.1 hypothetical protein [Streptomyces sp. ZAF1911]